MRQWYFRRSPCRTPPPYAPCVVQQQARPERWRLLGPSLRRELAEIRDWRCPPVQAREPSAERSRRAERSLPSLPALNREQPLQERSLLSWRLKEPRRAQRPLR